MSDRVVFVASPGGHVDEAFEIADRYADRSDRCWVTAKTLQTEALLADERVVWVPEVKSREAMRAAQSIGRAHRVMRSMGSCRVVSTGSALSVPYMVAAWMLRIPVTYVESATRMDAPSLTGRIAECMPGVELYYQGEGWSKRAWQPFGSIFDGYSAVAVPQRPARTALVTIGSEKYSFGRALRAVQESSAALDVSWQTGNTPVHDEVLLGEVRAWWPGDELAARAHAVDVVVTHAGVGSILMALRTGSCPVVIPRMKRYNEHIDDHQWELARLLETRGVVIVAKPGDDIADCISLATSRQIVKSASSARRP